LNPLFGARLMPTTLKPSEPTPRRLLLEYVPLDALVFDPKNARLHTKAQINQIAASIKAFSFNAPIPVDRNDIRARMGEAAWATQYMQRPAPAGGGLVNTEWFKRYAEADLPPAFDNILQSWDTANTIAEWSDYSVCTTWGIKDKRIYLLNVFRQRLIYPDLKRAVVDQAKLHRATVIAIEDRASGTVPGRHGGVRHGALLGSRDLGARS
jgi:hypothetical protein